MGHQQRLQLCGWHLSIDTDCQSTELNAQKRLVETASRATQRSVALAEYRTFSPRYFLLGHILTPTVNASRTIPPTLDIPLAVKAKI